MAEETKDGKMTNEKRSDIPNTIMLYTAYQFYRMINRTCIGTDDHLDSYLLSTKQKKTWQVPMMKIYNTALENVINSDLPQFSLKKLHESLGKVMDKSQMPSKARPTDDNNKFIICCIKVIYYNIVFCRQFKQTVLATFNHEQLDPKIIHLSMDTTTTAKVTQGIVKWHQNKCIKCQEPLSISFRNNQEDAQGQIAMVYHNIETPKICCNYRMRCQECAITYGYNRIDYEREGEKKTLFLDPSAFPYFAASQRSRNFIHQSILKAITDRQYSNKPQGIETWVNYYNLDRKDVYGELRKMIPAEKKDKIEVELGYKTILQSFYLYSALQRLCKIKDFGTIKINDHDVKVALILTDADMEKMQQRENIISECKVNENNKKNNFRENHSIFRFIVQQYGQEMLHEDMELFQYVPVKLAENGTVILIYPGWFVIYGDGNEKLFRPRCAYPAICAKYDYMSKESQTDANEIGNDEGIDFNHHNNAAKYSAQRYYECDNTPAFNDTNNNKLSFKTCKYHTYRLNEEYGLELHDISKFTTFYRIHALLAAMERGGSVLKSLNTTYTVDEEILNKITSRQKKKHENLKNQLSKDFTSEEASKFRMIIQNIYDKINPPRKDSGAPPRNAAIKAMANIIEQNETIKQTELSEQIHRMLADDDGPILSDYICPTSEMAEVLDLEFKSNEYLDKVKGCRKGKNFTAATACTTKGLNVWMNAAGLLISLREEIVRETPTGVILDVADILKRNETMKTYSQYIEAIGYDMMCRIYHHLKNIDDRLDEEAAEIWNHLIYRAFIDAWHIYTHTDDLCKKGGIFHPKSKKFENVLFFKDDPAVKMVLKRINDIIAEQFWAIMNGTKQMKSMAKETTFMFLLDKILYHNNKKKSDIEKEGWTFVSIDYFEPLKQADSNKNKIPKPEELSKSSKSPLQKVRVKSSCQQALIDHLRSSAQTAVQSDIQLPPQINSPNINKKRKTQKRKIEDTDCDTQSSQPSKRRKITAKTSKP